MKRRNGTISLWKFIFAIVIVLFHASAFYPNWNNYFVKGGYIAVEFFYVVSGYYLAKNILNKKSIKKNIGKETIEYVWSTITKLFPYLLMAYIFSMIIILSNNSFKTSDIANSIWNLLLLRQAGFASRAVSPQLWYITSMIITMLIFIPLLKKYKDNFILCASPLIIIFILGFLNHNWIGLDHVNKIWVGFVYTGTLRAIAEMNIGFILYEINSKYKTIKYTKIFQIILTLLPQILLIGVLFIIQFAPNPKVYDYILLFIISISILIITSDKTLEGKYLDHQLVYYLEKLSMPIFINHVFIIDFLNKINITQTIPLKVCSIIAVIVTIIFSALEIKIVEKILTEKNINKFKQKIIRTI